MDVSPEDIARAMGGASRSGNGWICRCPAHEDRHASLSVGMGESGKLLVFCHAGCASEDVIGHLRNLGMWPGSSAERPAKIPVSINLPTAAGRSSIVATYDYVDEHGTLLFQAVRFEPKSFRQRAPKADGSWTWSIQGVRRVLYRLPEVIKAVAEKRKVYICEGEKDVEAARSLGLVATCNPMGADNGTGNKWLLEFSEMLAGGDIVIVPDHDDAGIRHADWVISTLRGKARSVAVASPTTGKDLADWVEAGATVADIEAAAIDAFEVEAPVQASAPERKRFQFLDVADLIQDIRPIEWLMRDRLERDSIALIYGPPGGGKSFVAIDWAASVATGTDWLGHPVAQGTVFYIAGEGHNGLARRFRAWEIDRATIERGQIYKSGGALSVLDEAEVQGMVEVIEATGKTPAMVVIDTLARNFGPGDENSTEDMSRFIAHLDRHIRQRWGCCVLIVHHSGHNMERARGSSALKAAVDAEYEVGKDDSGAIRLRTTKMKDAELPKDLLLKLEGVEIPGLLDDDGRPVTSAVFRMAGNMILSIVAERSDGSKVVAKEALEALDKQWLSIRGLGEALGCSKRQAEKALSALRACGYIDGKKVLDDGRAALSRVGNELKRKPNQPIWKRGENDE